MLRVGEEGFSMMVKCIPEAWRLRRSCALGWRDSAGGQGERPAQWQQWGCRVSRGRGEKGLVKQVKDLRLHLQHNREWWKQQRILASSELHFRTVSLAAAAVVRMRQQLWECVWGKENWRLGVDSPRPETLVADEADSRGGVRIQRLHVLVGDWVWGLRKEAPRRSPQFLPWAAGCYSLR